MRKVLVVSDSAAVRETVDIVLADQFVVEATRSGVAASAGDFALVVIDADVPVPDGDAPVICLGDTRFRSIPAWRKRLYLPEPLDPLSLREAAAMLTEKAAVEPAPRLASSLLRPPFLPAVAVDTATRALGSALPLCIWGETGTGKLRLAHAIHAERGAHSFLTLAARELNEADPRLPDPATASATTLVVAGIESLSVSGQRRVRALLDEHSESGFSSLRLILTSRVEPARLVREEILDRDLYYRAGVLTIHLPPLRERSEEIAELAPAVAESLCRRLGLPPPTFTEAALHRLSRYLWFGNLSELEAVLARSIVFAATPVLDTADLRFGYGAARPATSAARAASAPTGTVARPRRAESNGVAMDLVIQELAHEFKNPMVTIKTFAHQIDHLLERDGGHEEFARLTGEAVERMDTALENLVQYTRFETPARQPASLGSIVSEGLAGVADYVEEKRLALEVEPTTALVFVDPAQCGYALKNLLRTVARELSNGDTLAVRAAGPAALAIEYPARARSAATALSKLVSGEANGKEVLPLGFTFARSLIERNGGRLQLDRDADLARVSVELPLGGDGKGENGKAEDSRS